MKYSVNRVSFPARQAAAPDERSNRRCFPAESTSRPDTAAKSDALMPLPLAIIVIACQRTSFANAASTVTGSSAGVPPAGEENSLLISQKIVPSSNQRKANVGKLQRPFRQLEPTAGRFGLSARVLGRYARPL